MLFPVTSPASPEVTEVAGTHHPAQPLPSPLSAQSPTCTFLHFVTQQEDLIPTKAAPRVPVYSADLELGSVGGT